MLVFLLVVLVVAAGLLFSMAGGIVAAVPIVLAVGVLIWLMWALLGGRAAGRVDRSSGSPELLGPGGPDDPANTPNHGV